MHRSARTLARSLGILAGLTGLLAVAAGVAWVAAGEPDRVGPLNLGEAARFAGIPLAAEPTTTPEPDPEPSATRSPSPDPSPSPTPRPSQTPTPTPAPTPIMVAAPLTGLPVPPEVAERRVMAVMIDDHRAARPQAGLSQADIVWHAPAEGGVPRYLALFQSELPDSVGPVRSARHYFIAWAAEWTALFVHSGGSPPALATLRTQGRGQLVYAADEFRYGGRYLSRSRARSAPHNIYTDGERLRALAQVVGAADGLVEPAWRFGRAVPEAGRPSGGSIEIAYEANLVRYEYSAPTNRYRRSASGDDPQLDSGTGERVAPTNVVILVVPFAPLAGDPQPEKGRLEAEVVGSGLAWVATNGLTIEATWHKAALGAPTLLLDTDGEPMTMTAGQTFIQVVGSAEAVTIQAGLEPRAWPPAASREVR